MEQKVWNGQHPWFSEINPWVKDGRKCLDITYEFTDANEFFDEDYIELGYNDYEDFTNHVWQRLLIRYYPDDESWESYQLWDTDNWVDAFPFGLGDEETAEVNEAIKYLKLEGALDIEDYNFEE